MDGVAVFDYQAWGARYPELAATIGEPQAAGYFADAGLYLNNTASSVVKDLPARTSLLYMVTAHLAQIFRSKNGALVNPLVGRISSATQGSVTVQATMDLPAGTAQWWNQTSYGAAFWAATARYRSMRYRPGHQPFQQPYMGGYPRV